MVQTAGGSKCHVTSKGRCSASPTTTLRTSKQSPKRDSTQRRMTSTISPQRSAHSKLKIPMSKVENLRLRRIRNSLEQRQAAVRLSVRRFKDSRYARVRMLAARSRLGEKLQRRISVDSPAKRRAQRKRVSVARQPTMRLDRKQLAKYQAWKTSLPRKKV